LSAGGKKANGSGKSIAAAPKKKKKKKKPQKGKGHTKKKKKKEKGRQVRLSKGETVQIVTGGRGCYPLPPKWVELVLIFSLVSRF